MAMSRDEKLEKVQRLLTAHRKTKEYLENEPVTSEIHPGTDIARNWTVITAAYSGLEQTIKYLIAEEKGLHIPELIDLREDNRNPYRTHDVAELFTKLKEPTQDVIRDFYGRFQSLHSYIAVQTVDEFLRAVSGPDGDGYERWRYALIENRDLPRNSPEALVKVWEVCVQIARDRAWKRERLQKLDEELTSVFWMELDDMVLNLSVDRQNAGEPFQDIAREIGDWLWSAGHPLNAFADVLWHVSRYGEHGQTGVSEWLSDALTRWANGGLKNPAIAGRTSLRAFMTRAQGRTPDGQSIRWNRNANRFEPVPWPLENLQQKALPPNAIVIGDPRPVGVPLWTLWQAAKESGYRVLENLGFSGPPDQEPWFRTHEVQAEDRGDARLLLTMWRKRDGDHDLFYMVEEQPRDTMGERVRRWIDVALRLGEMRAR